MKNVNLGLGIAIGVAIGLGIAYFSDKEKRDSFVSDIRSTADRTRDSFMEGYHDAKERYYNYRNKLKKEVENFSEDADIDIDLASDN